MINECEEHGYFRREKCPVCGRKGKFVMSDFEIEKLGRMMAAILRHGKFSPNMNEQGFVQIQEVVDILKEHNPRVKWLKPFHIDALALTDPKGRYQIKGQNVRATYGHTVQLDLCLPTSNIPEALYYPASEEDADSVLSDGILPSGRVMVHLSATYEDAINAGEIKFDAPVIFEVDSARCASEGHPIGRATKAVYLCDRVPADCVVMSKCETDKGVE